jgi:hypothetical protein
MSAKFLPLAVHQIEARPLSWLGFINDWTIYFPNNRLTSDERMGDISRTVVLLFPKSATASNSAKGVANLQGTSFVGISQTRLSIYSFSSASDMQGSCQRSSGMTP